MHHINLVAENIHSKALPLHKEYISYLKSCQKEVKKQLSLAAAQNREEIELVEQQSEIASLIEKNKQKPTKEEVVEYLKAMRREFLIEI